MLNVILGGLQMIFLLLDAAVYKLISVFYTIFSSITSYRFFNPATGSTFISDVRTNIYILIGIIALFKIVFALIMMIINPDMLSDKEKGGGKLITKFVTMLILIIAVPTIFDYAYKFQDLVLKENIIGKIIAVGNDSVNLETDISNSGTTVNSGGQVANLMFKSFVNRDEDVTSSNSDCDDANKAIELIDSPDPKKAGVLHYMKYANNQGKKDGKTAFCNSYMWGISTVAGGFAAWIFLVYCLDLGIRAVKLAFFEIIAPIPIASYVTSNGKEGPFNNWVKKCLGTYTDVFVRLIVINFIIQIIPALSTEIFGDGGIFAKVQGDVVTKALAGVAIILGILAFAKQAPQLIKDVIGIKGDSGSDLGFGLKKAAGIGAVGAVGAAGISNLAKTTRDNVKKAKKTFDDKDATKGQKVKATLGAVFGGGASALGGMGRAAAISASMIGSKDATMGKLYNKAFSTAANNRDNRDKRQAAGYTLRDNLMDRGRVLMGKDTKAKLLSDTYSNLVSSKQGNASQLRQAAFDFAYNPSNNVNQTMITEISNLIKDKDGKYWQYDEKGNKKEYKMSNLSADEIKFRQMLDGVDDVNLEAIKLGKVRDEVSRVKDNVTGNVKDSQ